MLFGVFPTCRLCAGFVVCVVVCKGYFEVLFSLFGGLWGGGGVVCEEYGFESWVVSVCALYSEYLVNPLGGVTVSGSVISICQYSVS